MSSTVISTMKVSKSPSCPISFDKSGDPKLTKELSSVRLCKHAFFGIYCMSQRAQKNVKDITKGVKQSQHGNTGTIGITNKQYQRDILPSLPNCF